MSIRLRWTLPPLKCPVERSQLQPHSCWDGCLHRAANSYYNDCCNTSDARDLFDSLKIINRKRSRIDGWYQWMAGRGKMMVGWCQTLISSCWIMASRDGSVALNAGSFMVHRWQKPRLSEDCHSTPPGQSKQRHRRPVLRPLPPQCGSWPKHWDFNITWVTIMI